MKGENSNNRKRNRSSKSGLRGLKIRYSDHKGIVQYVPASIVDMHEFGCGIELDIALQAGLPVTVVADRTPGSGMGSGQLDCAIPAKVVWCMQRPMGRYRVGISFMDAVEWAQETSSAPQPESFGATVDHYEIMQLSPNADIDTVHRVYRLLAQRFHPDNPDSGDGERFRQILDAYKVLSDPEQRAAYDAGHERFRKHRWRVFNQARAMQGMEAERVKRQGILALLYTKRMNYPEHPAMTLVELEDLLGIPRENLEFSMWYLKENGFAQRTDNGRYQILARGVDEAEKLSRSSQVMDQPLLEEGRRQEGGAAPAA